MENEYIKDFAKFVIIEEQKLNNNKTVSERTKNSAKQCFL